MREWLVSVFSTTARRGRLSWLIDGIRAAMLFDVLLVASLLVGSSVLFVASLAFLLGSQSLLLSQRIRDIGWPVVVTLPAYAVAYFGSLILSETRAPTLVMTGGALELGAFALNLVFLFKAGRQRLTAVEQ